MKRSICVVTSLVLLFSVTCICSAETRLDGYFIATKNCEAYQSFRKKTNPGSITLSIDMAYEVLSKNKPNGSHYRIRIKNASPKERWVQISCGKLLTNCNTTEKRDNNQPPETPAVNPDINQDGGSYLLALSWQPAYCQSHQGKKECTTQTSERFDADNFTLHGLWPQPKNNIYCNVSKNIKRLDKRKMWEMIPPLGLTTQTYGDLIETMPGVASYLHRHEWVKHGTCYSSTPEEYYQESIMLADQINNSAVRKLFADNIGNQLTSVEIKDRFNSSFGAGTGDKVRVKCSNGLITELWINLKGTIEASTDIRLLFQEAPDAGSSCRSGIIDAVGF